MGAMVLRAFRKLLGTESSLGRRARTRLVWLLVAAILIATPLVAQTPGTWEPAAGMAQGRAGHTATLLPNGKVLTAGGKDTLGPLATAEIYDPATGLYAPVTAPLPTPVWGHTATLLNDGEVLLVGGNGVSGQPVSAAQLFDPSTSTFTALTPMSTPRSQHTATLLGDGWVLIAGGSDGVRALAALELYYLGTGTFFPAPNSLLTPRQAQTATLLPDGRVLVVGGSNASGVLNSAGLYDPKDDTIVPAGSLSLARTQASAALLLDGTVLVAGGQDSQHKELYSAEVYALLTNTFTLLTALMTTARSGHIGLTLLHNGKALIAGGTSAGKPVATAEVYDPVLGQFWEVGLLNTARQLLKALCRFLVRPDAGSATRWLESRLARRVRTHAR